jgi:hypothetical protein
LLKLSLCHRLVRAFAVPRKISSRLSGALGERKSGMVFLVRLERERNSTRHSVMRRFFMLNVLAGRWFYYVLLLQDQSEWFFSAREFCRET